MYVIYRWIFVGREKIGVTVDSLIKKEGILICLCIKRKGYGTIIMKECFRTLSLTLHVWNCIIREVNNIYLSYMR